jgi:hypothetical protein
MKSNLLKIISLCSLFFFVQACTSDFDDINTNPNAPVTVPASLLLPRIQASVMGTLMGESWGIGNIVIQQTAKNQFVNEDRYLWGEINGIWNSVYGNARDLKIIMDQATASGENNYRGIALVMRSWMFSLATDAYGDIPYSEAIRGKEGVNLPRYDAQESIYDGILADLAEANSILGTSGEVVAGDQIFGGNIESWKKLANSLRIRALMRISNKRNVGPEIQAILSDPAKSPVFASDDDSAIYKYRAAAPDQFPLYTARIGSFNEFRAAKSLLDQLVAYNDPRLTVFFRPTPDTEGSADPEYVGIPNGMNDVDALTYNGGPQFQSRVSAFFFENAVTTEGLDIAKGVIMTYAELQFLLAEAAEKGLISGDAASFYANGISGSFAYYKLETPAGYLDQPDVAYAGSQSEKLVKIGTQKWISLFYQGLEAWFDWRRTGIPALSPAISNQNDNRIPVRFIYPIAEQALNAANRDEAVSRQGGDDINTKMWYLK